MIKYSTFAGTSPTGESLIQIITPGNDFIKTAGVHPEIQAFKQNITPENGKTYVHIIALGAGEYYGANLNNDYFSWAGLSNDHTKMPHQYVHGYKTFLNAHVFGHHKNQDPTKAYGDVLLSVLNDRMRRVELVAVVDHARTKEHGGGLILERLLDGKDIATSMGTRIPYDVCMICGNKAPKRENYCKCMKEMPGKLFPDGRKVCVDNPFPRFFDISFVYIGADRTSYVLEKIAYFDMGRYNRTEEELDHYFAKEASVGSAIGSIAAGLDPSGGMAQEVAAKAKRESKLEHNINKTLIFTGGAAMGAAAIPTVMAGIQEGIASSLLSPGNRIKSFGTGFVRGAKAPWLQIKNTRLFDSALKRINTSGVSDMNAEELAAAESITKHQLTAMTGVAQEQLRGAMVDFNNPKIPASFTTKNPLHPYVEKVPDRLMSVVHKFFPDQLLKETIEVDNPITSIAGKGPVDFARTKASPRVQGILSKVEKGELTPNDLINVLPPEKLRSMASDIKETMDRETFKARVGFGISGIVSGVGAVSSYNHGLHKKAELKIATEEKISEIFKEVDGHPLGKAVKLLDDRDHPLPDSSIEEIANSKHLPEILNSLGREGVALSPNEFTRIIIIRQRPHIDRREISHICPMHVDDVDDDFLSHMLYSGIPELPRSLSMLLGGRSSITPIALRRMMTSSPMVKEASVKVEMNKIASMYNAYRYGLLLNTERYLDSGIKLASLNIPINQESASVLGALSVIPLIYLLRSKWEKKPEQDRGFIENFVAKNPNVSAALASSGTGLALHKLFEKYPVEKMVAWAK